LPTIVFDRWDLFRLRLIRRVALDLVARPVKCFVDRYSGFADIPQQISREHAVSRIPSALDLAGCWREEQENAEWS